MFRTFETQEKLDSLVVVVAKAMRVFSIALCGKFTRKSAFIYSQSALNSSHVTPVQITRFRRGTFHGELFLARDVPLDRLTINEGSLKIVAVNELEQIRHALTLPTVFAIEIFLRREYPLRGRQSEL